MFQFNFLSRASLVLLTLAIFCAVQCSAKDKAETYTYKDVDLGSESDRNKTLACYHHTLENTKGNHWVYLPSEIWGFGLTSSHCNKTVTIKANGKTHTGKVVDVFTGTKDGLMVSKSLFDQFGDSKHGNWEIKKAQWKF